MRIKAPSSLSLTFALISFFFFCIPTWNNAQSGKSPYRLSWEKDLPIVLTGITLETIGLSIGNQVQPLIISELNQLNSENVNAFDRGAINQYSIKAASISDKIFSASFAIPLLLSLDKGVRNDYAIVSVMFLETLLINGAASQIATGLSQRIRPRVYNPDVPLDEKLSTNAKFSFFSGHTSVVSAMTFFTAKVYADYHPNSKAKYYIWGLAGLTSGLTGILRYKAGKHFPTDILFGFAVGFSTGFFIPHFHKKKLVKDEADSKLSFNLGLNSARMSLVF